MFREWVKNKFLSIPPVDLDIAVALLIGTSFGFLLSPLSLRERGWR